jgi:hypothetical protein
VFTTLERNGDIVDSYDVTSGALDGYSVAWHSAGALWVSGASADGTDFGVTDPVTLGPDWFLIKFSP